MRKLVPEQLNKARIRTGSYATEDKSGLMGAFILLGPCTEVLKIISSGTREVDKRRGRLRSYDWEHVSVSAVDRCPYWEEMNFVKDLFWDADEAVMQLHPPKSEYIDHHPWCLHLWRPLKGAILLPPSKLVGPGNDV